MVSRLTVQLPRVEFRHSIHFLLPRTWNRCPGQKAGRKPYWDKHPRRSMVRLESKRVEWYLERLRPPVCISKLLKPANCSLSRIRDRNACLTAWIRHSPDTEILPDDNATWHSCGHALVLFLCVAFVLTNIGCLQLVTLNPVCVTCAHTHTHTTISV